MVTKALGIALAHSQTVLVEMAQVMVLVPHTPLEMEMEMVKGAKVTWLSPEMKTQFHPTLTIFQNLHHRPQAAGL